MVAVYIKAVRMTDAPSTAAAVVLLTHLAQATRAVVLYTAAAVAVMAVIQQAQTMAAAAGRAGRTRLAMV